MLFPKYKKQYTEINSDCKSTKMYLANDNRSMVYLFSTSNLYQDD